MELDFAINIARKAGRIIEKGFRQNHDLKRKKEGWQTEIDRQSEAIIIKAIKSNFPSHSILGEETGSYRGDKNYQWYIDPLDGTTNYVHGIPYFGVSIALVKHGRPVLGVVYNPITGQLFSAEYNKGAFLNNNQIKVSQKILLKNSVFIFNRTYQKYSLLVKQTKKLGDALLTARMFGAISLDLCQVAAGYVDGLWTLESHPWDYTAGLLIAQESGAKAVKPAIHSPFKPAAIITGLKQSLLVANPKLLETILALY